MVSRKMGQHDGEAGGTAADDLLDSLGLDEVHTWRGREVPSRPEAKTSPARSQEPPRPPSPESRFSRPLVGMLGLALLALAGAAIWSALSGSDGGGETEALDGPTATVPARDLGPTASRVSEALTRLGFDEVGVEARGDVIYLDGSVSSEQDLSVLRATALAEAEAAPIDLSGVAVEAVPPAGPGAPGAGPAPAAPAAGAGPGPGPGAPPASPPPGFVPPTPEQRDNLQREVDRVLTETPLVFESGSTSLNELQLKVLDTVIIGLLEAHPGVPIRLVGYTDQSGSDFDNSLLSFDRATAVRDYLISRGVPDFILQAEGRGENDASGEADADRRVEIEVIDNP